MHKSSQVDVSPNSYYFTPSFIKYANLVSPSRHPGDGYLTSKVTTAHLFDYRMQMVNCTKLCIEKWAHWKTCVPLSSFLQYSKNVSIHAIHCSFPALEDVKQQQLLFLFSQIIITRPVYQIMKTCGFMWFLTQYFVITLEHLSQCIICKLIHFNIYIT